MTRKLATSTLPPISITNGHSGGQLRIDTSGPSIRTLDHDHNIDQKLITITEDKALICFDRNLRNIGKKRWVHPLSLLISLLMALATSEFNKLSWVDPSLLKALFIVTASITSGWLIWEIMHAGTLKDVPEVVRDIFRELRNGVPVFSEKTIFTP